MFDFTKDKIYKILKGERVEFKNENEQEMLIYKDSKKFKNSKGFFYTPKVNASN